MTTFAEDVDTVSGTVADRHGRPVKSIRLSVTQRCNLACDHCHREGQAPSAVEMTPGEIERLVEIATTLGVRKVKITGGEPLMRTDIADIVSRLSKHVKEVSLTTNGILLEKMVPSLKSAGLGRVNVSLHSLRSEVYESLCGVPLDSSLVRGIETAVKLGLNPVKVNMVVLKGYNENEIDSMMNFCSRVGAILQLIEYEESREGALKEEFRTKFFSLEGTERELRKKASYVGHNELHRRRQYLVKTEDGDVKVEVVRPMHNTEFCGACTRIRLSSDGRVKPCLMNKEGEVDVLSPLRQGADNRVLRNMFLKVITARRPYWG